MKEIISITVVALALSAASAALADEVTLIAPGGMRCAVDRMTPEFERKTGHTIKATIGSGGATHQQVVRGELFDVPIVQPPYQDVLASGNVVASSETPLATVPLVVVVRKGSPKPDISTTDAVRRMLLSAKSLSYPDGADRGSLISTSGGCRPFATSSACRPCCARCPRGTRIRRIPDPCVALGYWPSTAASRRSDRPP